MKTKQIFLIIFLFFIVGFGQVGFGQILSDDFEDGNLTGWGNTSDWANSTSSPINGTRSLKHDLSGVEAESYINYNISTLDVTTNSTTWRLNLANENWDPSTGNRFWFYLFANEANIGGTTVDGYVVGVNLTGSNDVVTIWKVTNGEADGAIITSSLDWSNNNTYGIEVTRSNTGLWELKTDNDGDFDNLVSAGTATNTDYTTVSHCGLFFDFSSTRAGKLRMDDVLITATPTSTNDDDSEASAPTGGQQTGGNISSLDDTDGEAISVFKFDIDDTDNTDTEDTKVTNIRIKPHSTNSADWTDNIQGVKLNGNTLGAITIASTTITDTYIDIAITSGQLDIPGGSSETITMSVYLNTSNIEDGEILSFMIDADDHNFTADATGSTFTDPFTADVTSNDFTITVVASELRFAEQPTNTNINTCMSPDVAVEATDENGNRDLGFSSTIRIISTGSLTTSPLDVAASSGIATFSGANCVNHDATGTNLELYAERQSGGDWDITSDQFNITDQCATELFISEYCEGSSDNKYIEIYNGTGSDILLTGNYRLWKITNGGSWPEVTFDLTGTISDGDIWIVAHGSANGTITSAADQTSTGSIMQFSGNDAMGLAKNDGGWYLIDAIGTDGADPGSGWDVAGTTNATGEHTLIRKASITTGNTNWGSSAGTNVSNSEWEINSQDYFSDLGSHTITCTCDEPTTHASSIVFSSIGTSSITLTWTNGDGNNRIVVAKANVAVNWDPTDNNTYTANSSFGSGTELGTGNFIVYNGSSNTVDITNLTPGTTYHFEIFEYNCSAGNEDYLTSATPVTDNETTLPENVSNFTVTCITNTTATITWTLPSGNFDGILIAARENTLTPSNPSCDGSTLSSPNTDFSSALVYCGNGTSSKYVYNASGTSVTITDLTPNADYVFKAFTYQDELWSSGTQSGQVAEVSDITNENAAPADQLLTVSWTNPTTCYDEILVLVHKNGSVTQTPSGDGSSYTADPSEPFSGTNLGSNDYVAYKGTSTNFDATGLTNGTQYCFKIFVRKDSEWSDGVEVCEAPANVTIFQPGELIIVGYDSNTGNGDDCLFLTSLVDIEPGTEFLYVNSRFEAGAAANTRTMEWHGGGDNPDADPGIFKISYNTNASGNIPAGSIIAFITTGHNGSNFKVDGVDNTDFSSTNISGSANIHATDGDQIWLIQGTFTDQGDYHTLDGNCLWGLTNNKAWVSITSSCDGGTGSGHRESRLHPDLECFNMEYATGKGYAFYENQANHNDTKRNLLLAIMNTENWQDGVGDNTMNFNADYSNPYSNDQIGKPFTITAGNSDGTWVGGAAGDPNNWFDCQNWEGLAVPDENMDVTIPNVTDAPDIICNGDINTDANKYNNVAECYDIDIDGETLTIDGSVADTLKVYGDLLIQNSGTLDMADGIGTDPDGLIYLSGNWTNNANFDEGYGTIIFNSSDAQIISIAGKGTETFNNLRLNNINNAGVLTNDNIVVNDTLSQLNNLFNLNGYNIELKGVYEQTNSFFEGDGSSNFTISSDADNGDIDSIYFKNDFSVNDFIFNRTGKSGVLMTDLNITNNLTITAGSVTLSAGKFYDVGNTLTNTPGTAAALILKSDASGTASLIQQTGAVPATCERYLTADNWNFIFTPLNNANIDILTTTSASEDNPNFYWYDETVADFWQGTTLFNPSGWTAPDHSEKLLTSNGYIHHSPENRIFSLTGGNLDDANKTFVLSYTDSGTGNEQTTGTDWDNFEGWNLLGNPYASALDWDNVDNDKSNIANFIYYYDGTNYQCYGGAPPWSNSGITINGGTQYIPANQAFFVKALSTANGTNLVLSKDARTHDAQSFYKNTEENILRINIQKDNYTDEIVIRAFDGATNIHDQNFDAYKMFSWNGTVPQLYSANNDFSRTYVINSIAPIIEYKTVPLGLSLGYDGEYTLNFSENSFTGVNVWLEDTMLEHFELISEGGQYTFIDEQGFVNNRFILHFRENTPPIAVGDIEDQYIEINTQWVFEIPDSLFIDNDPGDTLTINGVINGGTCFPDWLDFEDGVFTANCPYATYIPLQVIATDLYGESASIFFTLYIEEGQNDIQNTTNETLIYPNPTSGIVFVNMPSFSQTTIINIISINGKTISSFIPDKQNIQIDLSNYAKGSYIIEVINDNSTFKQTVIFE